MEFIETWWKSPNDALFVKKPSSEFWECIIVMFQLGYDFTQFASQCSFCVLPVLIQNLCILHRIQLNFCMHHSITSVEFLQSLYHWSLKNKLTLDLSRYIWKSLAGDTSCCNFGNCYRIDFYQGMIETWWKSPNDACL